jgi:hypothetical protein
MTTPDNHDSHDDRWAPDDTDEVFADLVASLPELAAIEPPVVGDAVDVVRIDIPHPSGGTPMRLAVEVPSEIAPMIRGEFSPDRIEAFMRALTAMTDPPQP